MNSETKMSEEQFAHASKLFDARRYTEAFEKFLKLANQGDVSAMIQVALMYGAGMGVECSFEESVRWDMEAAELGSESALFNLGISYRDAGDAKVARGWFERALHAGDGEAAVALAKMHLVSDLETERVRSYLETALKSSNICEETRTEAENLLSELKAYKAG